MTIGLTVLVERYLRNVEPLASNCVRPPTPTQPGRVCPAHTSPRTLDLEVRVARWLHASVDPRTWARRLKQLRSFARWIAVRAGHRSARRHDLRAASRRPGPTHLPLKKYATIGCRANSPQSWTARTGLRDLVRLDCQLRSAPVRGVVAEHRRCRSSPWHAHDPADEFASPGATASKHG